MIPLLIVVHWMPALPSFWRGALAAGVFAVAALTDFWDGWLARRLNQETRFGAFLDPVADKLLVTAALILVIVAEADSLLRASLGAAAIVIVGREICISALREWMALIGESKAVAVNIVGKWKTAAQMSAITMLLFDAPLGPFPTAVVGHVLLWLAALMTLWSMLVYLRGAWRHLRKE